MAEHRWDTEPSAADDPGTLLPIRRRWQLSFRAAVLAVSLLLGTAAAFAVFRGGDDIEVSSVELDPPQAGDALSTGGDHGGSPVPGGTAGEAGGTPAGPAASNSSSGNQTPAVVPAVLVVHIAGAVMHPGVVRVPAGSRTVDAVDAAGGAAPDADLAAVNLAAALQDGAMVLVPRLGDPPPVSGTDQIPGSSGKGTGNGGGDGNGTGAGSGPGLVNLNTASVDELDTLPRVGPVIAERIVAWRHTHGAFTRPEDLDAVPGIGETMLAALLPLITV